MKYYVIAILDQVSKPYERVHLNSVVEAGEEHDQYMAAALQAGAKQVNQHWRDWDEVEQTDWNYWLLAIVQLSPQLPVVYSGAETYMPSVSDSESQLGDPDRGPLWVAAGQTEDGDTWVQRLRAADKSSVIASLEKFLKDDLPFGAYGMVREDDASRYTVFDDSGESRSISTSASREPLVLDALAAINRHRAAMGMGPLDVQAAGWTEQDVLDEAERIARLPNPLEDLKHRLI